LLLIALLSVNPSVYALTFATTIRITTNTGDSRYPSVAAVESYVYVAWMDDTPVPGSGIAGKHEIWMRVSNNYGASFGPAIRMTTNSGDSFAPSVAAVGSYVYVAWMDNTPVTGNLGKYEIWMRVSSNNGGSFGSAIRITTDIALSNYPSVAAIGSYVYVAWFDDDNPPGAGGKTEVMMRVSSNYGASFGSLIRISTNTGYSEYPSVAADGSYVYVGWQDDTPVSGSGTKSEIWMRVSSNNGASFGSAIRISTNTGMSVYTSVAADGSYVYVGWQDDTPVTGSGTKSEIWMRVSSNNGASFGSAIRISTNAYPSEEVSVDAFGTYVYVAWADWTPVSHSEQNPEIWLRVSSNNGASFGSAIRITTNVGQSMWPSVAVSGSHVYLGWQDNTLVSGNGPPGSPWEIWLRAGS
jgi:hypothetical protein